MNRCIKTLLCVALITNAAERKSAATFYCFAGFQSCNKINWFSFIYVVGTFNLETLKECKMRRLHICLVKN